VRTYTFKVVVEPDGDRWHADCPALQEYGAATWGTTQEQAYRPIQEVVQMIIEEVREDGIAVSETPKEDVEASTDTKVAVTV
jgi:predicted RNase H-like HicB family nuclease